MLFHFCFVQVWVATESGNLEVTYTHNEDHVCGLWYFIFLMHIKILFLNRLAISEMKLAGLLVNPFS